MLSVRIVWPAFGSLVKVQLSAANHLAYAKNRNCLHNSENAAYSNEKKPSYTDPLPTPRKEKRAVPVFA